MSTEEPQKRLVGGLEYLRICQKRGMGYFFGGVLEVVGGIFVLVALFALCFGDWWCLFWGGAGTGMLWIGHRLFTKTLEAPPVELLTKSSAKRLPEVETLVRGSDRPAIDHHADLLRAAKPGQETPPEELLRATQGSKDNAL